MKFLTQHIKTIIIIIFSIVIIIFTYNYFSAPKPLPPLDINNMPPPPGNMPPPPSSIQKIKGEVMQYGSNRQEDIDKLLIDSNGKQLWIHFPPHVAKQVLNMAKLYTTVAIEYAERPDKKNLMNNEMQSISIDEKNILNVRSIAPPPPTRGNEVTISCNKIDIKKDDNGRATSFVLAHKLVVLPPHAADDLLPLLMKAKSITVKGFEGSDDDGSLNMDGLQLVRPNEIRIDSVNYLVQ